MSSFKKLYIKKFYNFIKNNYNYNLLFNYFSFNNENVSFVLERVSFIKYEFIEENNVILVIKWNGIKFNNLFINYENIHSINIYDNNEIFIDVINYYSNDFLVLNLKTNEIKEIKSVIKNNMYNYFTYHTFKKLKN